MVGISAVLFSCNKQESVAPDLATSESPKMELSIKDVEIQDGVLKFASKEHLKKVTQEIGTMQDMENWYPNSEFFSLLMRQKAITNSEYDKIGETGEFGKLSDILTFRGEGDDKILSKIVEVNEVSAVLSSKSYVIVSDTAYHIGTKQVTFIHIGEDPNILSSFLMNRNIPGARTVEITRTSLNNARTQSHFQHTVGKRRIYASNEIISFGGLGEYREVYVEYLKKNWVGWSRTEAPYLSITVTASASPYVGGQQLSRKVEGWNVEVVGVSGSETIFGTPVFYNFNAHMYCITPHETYDLDF